MRHFIISDGLRYDIEKYILQPLKEKGISCYIILGDFNQAGADIYCMLGTKENDPNEIDKILRFFQAMNILEYQDMFDTSVLSNYGMVIGYDIESMVKSGSKFTKISAYGNRLVVYSKKYGFHDRRLAINYFGGSIFVLLDIDPMTTLTRLVTPRRAEPIVIEENNGVDYIGTLLEILPDRRSVFESLVYIIENYYYALNDECEKVTCHDMLCIADQTVKEWFDILDRLMVQYREQIDHTITVVGEVFGDRLEEIGLKYENGKLVYETHIIPQFVYLNKGIYRLKDGHPYFVKDFMFDVRYKEIYARDAYHPNITAAGKSVCVGRLNKHEIVDNILNSIMRVIKSKEIMRHEERQNLINNLKNQLNELTNMFKVINNNSSHFSVNMRYVGSKVGFGTGKDLSNVELRRI